MTAQQGTPNKFDDVDYPAYTMGRAADLLGVQPAFLRSLDAAGLLTPRRSPGGQRRYSRAELTLATRVRELLDQNMPLAAAIRIVSLEHRLGAAETRPEAEARVRYLVNDVAAAVRFYREYLGFEVEIDAMPGFAALRRGSLRLLLTSAAGPGADGPGAERPGAERPGAERPGAERPGAERPGAERPGGAAQMLSQGSSPAPGGWNRIQLEVPDLAAEVARLRAAGLQFRNNIVTGRAGKQILLVDPSGNLVELFQSGG